jgi:hypothetical protein
VNNGEHGLVVLTVVIEQRQELTDPAGINLAKQPFKAFNVSASTGSQLAMHLLD